MSLFKPKGLPLLIGSLPTADPELACELVFSHTPEIPLWPQLSRLPQESMIQQFAHGMPGLTTENGRMFIDTTSTTFEQEMLGFYEDYLLAGENPGEEVARFTLSPEAARGFQPFLARAAAAGMQPAALKGQTTGPLTFCTGVVDQDGRAIFYNEQLRDAAIKLLALKARWQVRKMADIASRVIMFFDEPALAGFGSSAFITITPEDVAACFAEVFDAVHQEHGLTGVHVCANTEWPVLFDSAVDVISFDAYSYFDRLILYRAHLTRFLERGGILAWGSIPTSEEFLAAETVESLMGRLQEQIAQVAGLGIPQKAILEQSFITPSCGTGTISSENTLKVLRLTRDLSDRVRLLLED